MNKSDSQIIGTLAKLHGFKGNYMMISENALHDDITNWESVFLDIEGLLVPFFINHVAVVSETSAIIGFEDIDSSEKAKEFLYSKVYQLVSLTGTTENLPPKDVTGYRIVDRQQGEIGRIAEILDYNQNLLFRILKGKQEILIPVNEEIIVTVNHRKKEIVIDAPEGLLDIND